MTDIKRIGDSGIHTVEGNLAGSRAARLTKERDAQKAQYEAVKSKIKEENAAAVGQLTSKFSAASDSVEQEFRRQTVGLVSADDFRKAREVVEESAAAAQRQRASSASKASAQQQEAARRDGRDRKRKLLSAALSFAGDDDDNNAGDSDDHAGRSTGRGTERGTGTGNGRGKGSGSGDDSDGSAGGRGSRRGAKKIFKNPAVDTSFLPDLERDRQLQQQREELKQQWLQQQEVIKNELLQVTYSYWDGSGHRKAIELRKGTTVGRFLELVKQQLLPEFYELRATSAEDLVYVKEDLIIPHHVSFYDLIVTKARGKSGPLFHFDVHDDIRLVNDATVEKDESHPGKVVERRWYEKNKHIFPASRWETYDPNVSREQERYTIHGGETN